MATIHSLAPELLYRIITSAFPRIPFLDPHPDQNKELWARYDSLCAWALVARAWRLFAQETLWEDVVLTTPDSMERFRQAGPGRYPIVRLKLVFTRFCDQYYGQAVSNFDTTWLELEPILRRCQGVRELDIMDWGRGFGLEIDWMTLAGPQWSGLRALRLQGRYVRPSSTDQPMSFAFTLSTLYLSMFEEALPSSEFLRAICGPSLTSLGFQVWEDEDIDDSFTLYLPIAHQLAYFQLAGVEENEALDWEEDSAGRRFFRQCTQLKHLVVSDRRARWEDDLRTPLNSLRLEWVHEDDLPRLLDALKSTSVAVSKLEKLWINYDDRCPLEWERWGELASICQSRRIKLDFSDKSAEDRGHSDE